MGVDVLLVVIAVAVVLWIGLVMLLGCLWARCRGASSTDAQGGSPTSTVDPATDLEESAVGRHHLLEQGELPAKEQRAGPPELPRTPSACSKSSTQAEGTLRVKTPQAWEVADRAFGSADLTIMTLNFQYFASYPKDEAAAEARLTEVLDQQPRPDFICVQEGLSSRNVLGAVDFELCVCSAQEGMAQSVHDMVYGDQGTLNACDPSTHSNFLCNQIYMRRGSAWQIVDRGALQVSSNLQLTGGGGRTQGKLAIRSMVWVKVRAATAPGLHAYVMCTHITGGRFEDQYFVQELAEERRMQIDRVIRFFDARPDPDPDDVGILVGDFNATTVYTADGPMHGYFKHAIATSAGVKADAEAATLRGDEALEGQFKDYMTSPFTSFHKHGWTFAYDRQQVGYTSGFGHCIDHMAMSRSLQVCNTDVFYLTNQKFGGLPQDTVMPLTDHNSVKTTFRITRYEERHTSIFRTEYDFLQHLRRFRAVVHISGFGNKQQYADVDAVVDAVAGALFKGSGSLEETYGSGNWAMCFGGDPLDEANPDVAVLVQRLQRRGVHLIAIQADIVEREWGGVDKHIDAVYYYPTAYMEDGKTVAWGGFCGGKLVGTTRILLEVNPLSGIHLFWIAAGGGDITEGELRAAWERNIAILSIQARARKPQDPALPYGPCGRFWDSLTDYETVGGAAVGFRRRRLRE